MPNIYCCMLVLFKTFQIKISTIRYSLSNVISPGNHVFSIQGFKGTYTRRITNQLFPGMVCHQLFSKPTGAFGEKNISKEPSSFCLNPSVWLPIVGRFASLENENDLKNILAKMISDKKKIKNYKSNTVSASAELNWQKEFEKVKYLFIN